MANAGPNVMECIEPETGTIVWKKRLPGGACWSSLVAASGHLYVTDQDGTTHVMQVSRDGVEFVSSNRLDEPGNSTPAVADGRVYIRTFRNLYCVAE